MKSALTPAEHMFGPKGNPIRHCQRWARPRKVVKVLLYLCLDVALDPGPASQQGPALLLGLPFWDRRTPQQRPSLQPPAWVASPSYVSAALWRLQHQSQEDLKGWLIEEPEGGRAAPPACELLQAWAQMEGLSNFRTGFTSEGHANFRDSLIRSLLRP